MTIDIYQKFEKINGNIYDISRNEGFYHSQVSGNMLGEILSQLKSTEYFVTMKNFKLSLSDDEYVMPDIMVINNRTLIKKDCYYGVPEFIAEILSPATALKDRTVKLDKYKALGVNEYWIIEPKGHSLEIYYLEDSSYKLAAAYILEDDETDAHYNADTVLTLKAMPNISFALKEIFENAELE